MQMANLATWGALALGSASVAFLPAEAFIAPASPHTFSAAAAAAVDGTTALSSDRSSSSGRRQSALSMAAAEGAKKKVGTLIVGHLYCCMCM